MNWFVVPLEILRWVLEVLLYLVEALAKIVIVVLQIVGQLARRLFTLLCCPSEPHQKPPASSTSASSQTPSSPATRAPVSIPSSWLTLTIICSLIATVALICTLSYLRVRLRRRRASLISTYSCSSVNGLGGNQYHSFSAAAQQQGASSSWTSGSPRTNGSGSTSNYNYHSSFGSRPGGWTISSAATTGARGPYQQHMSHGAIGVSSSTSSSSGTRGRTSSYRTSGSGAAMQHISPAIVWEYRGNGKWVCFKNSTCKQIEARLQPPNIGNSTIANTSSRNLPPLVVVVQCRRYEIDVNAMKLWCVDGRSDETRRIRRKNHTFSASATQAPLDGQQWQVSPQSVPGGCRYDVRRHMMPTHVVCRDIHVLNFAAGHVCGLMGASFHVTNVKMVQYYDVPRLLGQFNVMSRSLRDRCGAAANERLWIFHGTADDKIYRIMMNGFKVGGSNESVPITNGRLYGTGVYTAKGPRAPAMYYRAPSVPSRTRTRKLILAIGLVGKTGSSETDHCDSWMPQGTDYVIFQIISSCYQSMSSITMYRKTVRS